ncbi:hypothetical protein AMJ44_09705 [candidate division WOR-1 bacterium DG_54_3]|uniref:Type 4 fimbrial biogenesis protein PilX N-terminal domain-containing protein n=1 Tax=candidate division WOR-1 bacterium DG_54_3 TaxID=1703775 RepID=A0A0S7XUC1_UNCSA|nr:MAG: hypothetical protein AMJ44_09705 [candidate division WOR-1 bacterium DG_54_3]
MKKRKKGFTIIAAVFIVLAMTFLAIATSTFISSDAVIASKNYHSLDAFYIAEAGIQYYLKQLVDDDNWSTPPPPCDREFSGGTFSLVTTDERRSRITVTATGVVTVGANTYTRSIRLTAQAGGLAALASEYVVYYTGGGNSSWNTNVDNNALMNGSVLLNSNLNLGLNDTVSGDAYTAGNITGDTSGITGTIEPNAEMPLEVPTLETSYFGSELAIAATYPPGDKTYSGTQNLSGTTYVNGDITIDNGANITITGTATLVATGKFTIENLATVGDNLTVIIGGKIDVENDLTVGSIGIWYSGQDISIDNNVIIGGKDDYEGSRFITPGDITVKNNCTLDGLFYASGQVSIGNNLDYTGMVMTSYLKSIGENVVMDTGPETLDWNGIGEIVYQEEGGFEIQHWDEVY